MFFSSFLAGARFFLTKTLWIPKIFSEKVVWQADFYETFPFKATAYFPAESRTLIQIWMSRWCCTRRRNTAKQHCCVIVLNSYNMVSSNIATQCCTKNRRCESSRVTSPLGIEDTGLKLMTSQVVQRGVAPHGTVVCYGRLRFSLPTKVSYGERKMRGRKENLSFLVSSLRERPLLTWVSTDLT